MKKLLLSVVLGFVLLSAQFVTGQPVIHVTPDSMFQYLAVGDTAVQTLRLSNTGTTSLTYNLSFQGKLATLSVGELDRSVAQSAAATVPQSNHQDSYRSYAMQADKSDAELTQDAPPNPAILQFVSALHAPQLDSFVIFSDDMEHGVNGWTHRSLHVNSVDQWGQTTVRSSSASTSWNVSQHSYEGDDALQSPMVNLTNFRAATLVFNHWYNFDDCSDPNFDPDGGVVEVTVDGGTTWTRIDPVGGYPYVLDDICLNPLAGQPAYAHDGGLGSAFVPAVFDLTPFVGNTVSVRFRAGWDCGNCNSNEGWYIDDVAVYSTDYVNWVSASPTSGTVTPGGFANVLIAFDGRDRFGGQYLADIVIANNDPVMPEVRVPTVLRVTGVPHIVVTPLSRDLGSLFIGLSTTATFTVANTGTDVLHVSAITTSNPDFTTDSTTLTIPPTESRTITARFSPSAAGLRIGTLDLVSDDPSQPTIGASLQGTGLVPPDINVTPDSLDASLFTGATETRTLTIQNLGGADLTLTATTQTLLAPGMSPSAANDLAERMNSSAAPLQSQSTSADRQQQSTNRQVEQLTAASGYYSGDFLFFGLSDYGEIMPFQYPIGTEHLQVGTFRSGYTVAYKVGGINQIAVAGYDSRTNIVPVSYTVLVNTTDMVQVEVVTKTSDNVLQITHTFLFNTHDKFVSIQAKIDNISGGAVTNVTYKSYADWDTDGVYTDNWDYDLSRNMVYSSWTHFTALASSRTPTLMDIDGWNDWNTRQTIVNYPTGPVTSFDGLAVLHFDLGDLATGGSVRADAAYAAANSLAELQAVMDRGRSFFGWLSVTPVSLVVPAGASQTLSVKFDATGLWGGDYYGKISVLSNDPDESTVAVPAHLKVTGAPNIVVTPDSINFGSQFVGFPRTDTILVLNQGTDILHVTGIASSNSDFAVGVGAFNLSVGASRKVPVTFTPSASAPISGVLTINSDDPDVPSKAVPVKGIGLIPPDIEASPDSLDAALFTGNQTTRPLTISNLGGSDLVWSIDINAVALSRPTISQLTIPEFPSGRPFPDQNTNAPVQSPSWRTASISATLADLTGVHILFNQYNSYGYPSDWSTLMTDLQNRGATVAVNNSPITPAILNGIDVFWMFDSYGSWTPSEYTALNTWLLAGGALLIEGDESISVYNTVLSNAGAGIVYQSQSPPSGTITTAIYPHPTTAGIDSIYNTNPLSRLMLSSPASKLVDDVYGGTDVAFSVVGNGRIVAMADENFGFWSIGAVDNQLFGNQVFDWLAQATNIFTVDNDHGTIPAGGSTVVNVLFDARGLYGGDYLADLMVRSNDPDENPVRVPAHLHVTGAPDIVVAPDSINYGPRFIGFPYRDSILVRNVGTDVLHVSNITSTNANFVPGTTSFTLNPEKQLTIPIVFTPTVTGPITATLTVANDDPDTPARMVLLKGVGVIPPDISVTPDSLDEHLLTNQTKTRNLTVVNNGGSDLILTASTQILLVPGEAQSAASELLQRMEDNGTSQQSPSASTIEQQTQGENRQQNLLAAAAGTYVGDFLRFGLSDYGEIMPFQYPIGTEHLQLGSYRSGYTVAYTVGGFDRVAFAGYDNRSNIVPVRYTVLVNTADAVQVEVVTKTSDNVLQVTHTFLFNLHDKYINIQARIDNVSGGPVTNVVYKSYADWDTDGDYYNNWDYDLSRNMVFSSKTHFTALASSRVPTLMDINGWNDYDRRQTSVEYPSGPVAFFDGLAILHFALGDLASGGSIRADATYAAANSLAELQGVMDRGRSSSDWLSVTPASLTVPAGSSRTLSVKFDATSKWGGDYYGEINILSNDPDEQTVGVPAHLKVSGVPDIAYSPDSLVFGSLFIGATRTDSITIHNIGTDQLEVGSISVGNSHFAVNPASMSLAPMSSRAVLVTFSPTIEGDRSTTLSVTSNDPDHPSLSIPIHGSGLRPPVIEVTPSSLSVDLLLAVNPTKTDTFTVRNTGFSDLIWSLDFSRMRYGALNYFTLNLSNSDSTPSIPNEPISNQTDTLLRRSTPLRLALDSLKSVVILFDQYHSNLDASYFWTMRSDLTMRGATVNLNYSFITPAVLQGVDVFWLTDHAASFAPSELTALRDWTLGGGSLLIEGDQSIDTYNALLSAVGAGITYLSQSGVSGYSSAVFSHPTTEGVDSIFNGNALALLLVASPAGELVRDATGGVNITYSRVGLGNIIAMADENFGDGSVTIADNQLFGNQVFDWLAHKGNWLVATPVNGTVPSGATQKIAVTMNGTGLSTGTYTATIDIHSNDPLTPTVNVPVTLRVREYLCGDVNRSGVVDPLDLNYLMAYYFECFGLPTPPASGDLDCNGVINLADLEMLARNLAGTGTFNCCR